jgi:hypothetical protein
MRVVSSAGSLSVAETGVSRELVGGELVHARWGHNENEYNESRSKSVKAVKKAAVIVEW